MIFLSFFCPSEVESLATTLTSIQCVESVSHLFFPDKVTEVGNGMLTYWEFETDSFVQKNTLWRLTYVCLFLLYTGSNMQREKIISESPCSSIWPKNA